MKDSVKMSINDMFENENEKLIEFLKDLNEISDCSSDFCAGDYQHSKKILSKIFENESDINDMFEFFKKHGGYCDCEILYNVPENLKLI